MRLKTVRVTEFQSIRDSNEFEVGEITCMVGKNEAGKTALLQALRRLNPVEKNLPSFSVTDDYPRRDVEDYLQDVETGRREHAPVVKATFELDDADVALVTEDFGGEVLKSRTLTLKKGYSNELGFQLDCDDTAANRHLVAKYELTTELVGQLKTASGTDAMLSILAAGEQTEHVNQLTARLKNLKKSGVSGYVFNQLLHSRVPKFMYFDEYYQLRGNDNIEELKKRRESNKLKPYDYPLLGLINLARLNLDELLNPGRTQELKNKLEGAGNHLTKQIIKHWSQNKHLQVRFDVRPGLPKDPEGMRTGTNIWAEVYDIKHLVSTGLGTRSRGFVWFFSFLAWYSDLKKKAEPLVLLLDEPGLFLHAKAQEDLLRYFEADIKDRHQLLYTTHSPFMVDPRRFDRVRIVEDKSIDADEPLPEKQEGTKVLTDVLEASGDSLFPLQGALGYEIYQTLFIGPNSLVVEGVSDLMYLQVLGLLLQRSGGEGFDGRWTITPVGGADKIPTFVALIGSQKSMNVATLMDFHKKDRQMIENIYKRKLLKKKNVVTYADFTCGAEADIEDMFDPSFYLQLVNKEYANSLSKPVALGDLEPSTPRIVVRLERYFTKNPLKGGVTFNHYRPANYLAINLDALATSIDADTQGRFTKLFAVLKALL